MLRPILVILENGVVIFFTYRKGPLVECFATQNAIYLGSDNQPIFTKWGRYSRLLCQVEEKGKIYTKIDSGSY